MVLPPPPMTVHVEIFQTHYYQLVLFRLTCPLSKNLSLQKPTESASMSKLFRIDHQVFVLSNLLKARLIHLFNDEFCSQIKVSCQVLTTAWMVSFFLVLVQRTTLRVVNTKDSIWIMESLKNWKKILRHVYFCVWLVEEKWKYYIRFL